MRTDPIVTAFTQKQFLAMKKDRAEGLSYESLAMVHGSNRHSVMRYFRVYDRYGIEAFRVGK